MSASITDRTVLGDEAWEVEEMAFILALQGWQGMGCLEVHGNIYSITFDSVEEKA